MTVRTPAKLGLAFAASALLLGVGGCAYDYQQRSDHIAFSAGNAVKANLERETDNPSRTTGTSTKGLGKNGVVIPPSDSGDTGN